MGRALAGVFVHVVETNAQGEEAELMALVEQLGRFTRGVVVVYLDDAEMEQEQWSALQNLGARVVKGWEGLGDALGLGEGE